MFRITSTGGLRAQRTATGPAMKRAHHISKRIFVVDRQQLQSIGSVLLVLSG
jgi:hypothetical protein